VIPDQATIAALALLFDRFHLPNNIEFVVEFAKSYRLTVPTELYKHLEIEGEPGEPDPFNQLSELEKETAFKYLDWARAHAVRNLELFGPVIESDLFKGTSPLTAELVEQGAPGELNKYRVSQKSMSLVGGAHERLPRLIRSGYIPVVGQLGMNRWLRKDKQQSAKELATLLAIKSVAMFFPATEPARAEVILEARERLRDHLPLFWSAMFKLSLELKKAIQSDADSREIDQIGTDLVDTVVRPAVTELNYKIERERKQWFRRIFGDVYKSLKLTAANPPLTPGQLVKTSLQVGADAAMHISEVAAATEELKAQTGLTYLLELGNIIGQKQ
jgi:hypothetical protein